MAQGDDSWSVVYEAGCCMALVLINQTEWSTTPACSNHVCFLFNKVVLKGLRKKKFDVCIFCFIFVLGLI